MSRIKYVRAADILSCFVFLFMMPIALIAKIFIRNFWLVGEERTEARDNGYWFFKWVRENKPDQKIAYVIDKKCHDYAAVKDLGKTVQWGGISHWFWYLVAQKNISSQKGCKPNAAACYFFENTLRLWRNKRYFLQHGVIINDLKWLYHDKCYFKLFCCSAKPEYDFVSERFGYPKGVVEYVGQPRFDNLHTAAEKKRQVLVMPTWRGYLIRPHGNVSEKTLAAQFTGSNYFKAWSEFLKSDKLQSLLEKYNYSLLFYPHRNMQRFLKDFTDIETGCNVSVADPETLGVQQALMQSACLITDYSSVFFDFAYMKKPIIFYQFDEAEFRSHQYDAGYFDYHKNPLGKWCGKLDDCLELLESVLSVGCPNNDHVKEFFELYDDRNCERVYNAVLSH